MRALEDVVVSIVDGMVLAVIQLGRFSGETLLSDGLDLLIAFFLFLFLILLHYLFVILFGFVSKLLLFYLRKDIKTS